MNCCPSPRAQRGLGHVLRLPALWRLRHADAVAGPAGRAAHGRGCTPHSVTHADLAQAARDDARREIEESGRYLGERHSVSVYAFAYPFGSYTDREARLLEDAGFECGLTSDPPFNSGANRPASSQANRHPDDAEVDELLVEATGVWWAVRAIVPARRRNLHRGSV
jgi:peptidoglycan/xylan/chitin deacetylase (PgdA/CDA1 family)